MMKSKYALLALAIAVLAGCDSKPAETTPPAAGSTGATASTSGTPEAKPSGDGATAAKPDISALPAELKNEAYEYYGLANAGKPMDMEIVRSTDPAVLTGTQTVRLDEIKDGKATFKFERTGGLDMIGAESIVLTKEGVYLVDAGLADIKEPQLELSSKLTPGSTWTSQLNVPGKMELKNVYTVKGVVDFKTKKGPRKGLLVVATGKGTIQGKAVTITSKEYYVKGVGGVKAEVVNTTADGQKQTLTIEEAK